MDRSRLRDVMAREMRIRGLADRTVEAYVADVRLMLERTGIEPGRMSEEQVKGYLDDLRGVHGASPSTWAQHLNALRFFYKHVVVREYPVLKQAHAVRRRRLPDVLSVEETLDMLHRIRVPRLYTFCGVTYGCGLRRNEALYLRVADVDGKRRMLKVVNGKGGRDRLVPLSLRALEILREHVRREGIREGSLFPSPLIPGRVMGPDCPSRALRLAAGEAGIAKHVTLHTLRHCYATHLLERGVSIRLIQQLLGHRSIESTALYTHLTDSSAQRMHEALELMTSGL